MIKGMNVQTPRYTAVTVHEGKQSTDGKPNEFQVKQGNESDKPTMIAKDYRILDPELA